MPFLEDMKAILVAGGMTDGSIYLSGLPEHLSTAVVALYEVSSGPAERAMGGVTVERRFSLQVICRGPKKDYAAARALAETVYGILGNRVTTVVNGSTYDQVVATGSPSQLPLPDDNDAPLVVANYDVMKAGA